MIGQTGRKQPGEEGKEARRLRGGVRRDRASLRRSRTVRGQEMDNRRQVTGERRQEIEDRRQDWMPSDWFRKKVAGHQNLNILI